MVHPFADPKRSRALSARAQIRGEGLMTDEKCAPLPGTARHFIEAACQSPIVART